MPNHSRSASFRALHIQERALLPVFCPVDADALAEPVAVLDHRAGTRASGRASARRIAGATR